MQTRLGCACVESFGRHKEIGQRKASITPLAAAAKRHFTVLSSFCSWVAPKTLDAPEQNQNNAKVMRAHAERGLLILPRTLSDSSPPGVSSA